jgi:hypothetical protein
LETGTGFGNPHRFWKPPPVLETGTGFGNSPHFWKPPPVLETLSRVLTPEITFNLRKSSYMDRYKSPTYHDNEAP